MRFADLIFNTDECDFDPTVHKPYQATSVADLLKTFDDNVRNGKQAMAGAADKDIMQPWRFKVMGRLLFERPRAAAFRDFTLSHQIHHRGQFSVYLRLLNVSVPGSYGRPQTSRAERSERTLLCQRVLAQPSS